MAGRIVAHGHFRHDAHTEPELYIGLDNVRVDRLQHDGGVQASRGKSLVDARSPGERRVIGNERFLGKLLECQPLLRSQRVALWQHDHVLPLVAGQGEKGVVLAQGLGSQPDLCGFVEQHLRHLLRGALVQADGHLGVALAKRSHRGRQDIARLRVGGGDGERAGILLAEFFADAPQVGHLPHDDLHGGEHLLPRLGHALEPLAVPREDVDAELAFEFEDRFGDARLRGVQCLGRFGEIEVAPCRFLDEPELMQVHGPFARSSAAAASAAMSAGCSPMADVKR